MPARDIYIDIEGFKQGLYKLEDTTKAPHGSARIMKNVQLTDRGGIGPRPGTELLGTENTSSLPIRGLYNFRKSFDSNEILVKAYHNTLEGYSKNHTTNNWWSLKSGFTSDQEFGFVTSLVNVDNQDYLVFCNRYEPYQRWTGSITKLNGALVGGETSVIVDSILTEEIYDSKTATGSSATTLTVAGAPWGTSQWIGLYVYIKSGVNIDKISKITANTTSQITFDTLGSDPGSCDFEIRMTLFPATGSITYAGTSVDYTAIPKYNEFTVVSAHAGTDNSIVTLTPTEYPGLPRGNRLTNYLARIIVGRVRSAKALNSGGTEQGYTAAGSFFVSKIKNPFDFTYAASRLAGEGDVVGTPYGGGEIEDIVHQENNFYIFKRRYIESCSYSQDANDLIVRDPLKAEVGSKGLVIKGSDDIYFITDDNRFTSIGRVLAKDVKPQTENIGHKIKRLLDVAVFGEGRGKEYQNKIYLPHKESSLSTYNDKLLIYNKDYTCFEGLWDVNANYLEGFNGGLYYGGSSSPNVYKMLTGHSDVAGANRFPISSEYATHFMNLTASKDRLQALDSLYFEGYIKGDTKITFQAFKDFSSSPFLQFDFSGNEEVFLQGKTLNAFLGGTPFGLSPMGALSEVDLENDGMRYFKIKVYFPFQYANYFSIGWKAFGLDYDYDVIRCGLGLKESVSIKTSQVKTI